MCAATNISLRMALSSGMGNQSSIGVVEADGSIAELFLNGLDVVETNQEMAEIDSVDAEM